MSNESYKFALELQSLIIEADINIDVIQVRGNQSWHYYKNVSFLYCIKGNILPLMILSNKPYGGILLHNSNNEFLSNDPLTSNY